MMLFKRSGVTLMELLVAIPIFAFVALGVAYLLSSASMGSVVNRDLLKCQIAVNNLITYIEAMGVAKEADGVISGCDASGVLNEDVCPDDSTDYKATLTYNSAEEVHVVSVSKGDMSASVKTYFLPSFFKK
ncbi:MAG: prepilin-type N-terminal cleavage/methylation domain-containing protein [Candidatus Riflebacteria bacterium]|nr:prepilin-type N-terminal cleavage/methylation domain-containing protein [Candidatus Riflebacteria bacterium]